MVIISLANLHFFSTNQNKLYFSILHQLSPSNSHAQENSDHVTHSATSSDVANGHLCSSGPFWPMTINGLRIQRQSKATLQWLSVTLYIHWPNHGTWRGEQLTHKSYMARWEREVLGWQELIYSVGFRIVVCSSFS